MEILDTASSLENAVDFTDAEVAVVKKALHTKLFRRGIDSPAERLAKFQLMVTELSELFGIPQVRLATGPEREPGFVAFNPEANTLMTEAYLSLVTTLFGFGLALTFHKPELRGEYDMENDRVVRPGLHPMAFALALYKQAAPRMFEEAKSRGRLCGTSVEYTDDGRLTAERRAAAEAADAEPNLDDTGEDSAPEGGTTDLPAPAPRRIQPPRRAQRPDVDPENRADRGNGLGED
jgi:hypothetical protein